MCTDVSTCVIVDRAIAGAVTMGAIGDGLSGEIIQDGVMTLKCNHNVANGDWESTAFMRIERNTG